MRDVDTMIEQFTAALASARFQPSPQAHPHIAARFLGTPLMVEPLKLRTILSLLGPNFGVHGVTPLAEAPATLLRADRSYDYKVLKGVAVIQVFGSVVKRNGGNVLNSSGMVSMEALRETLAQALADESVKAVLLQIDSFGGEAVGTPEMAAFIDAACSGKGAKRIECSIDDAAYSAGCYLASACNRVGVTPTGGGGSIGVIALHVDASAAIEAEGYKLTPIFAGARKIDGNEWSPLSAEAFTRFQAEVDAIWTTFARDVGRFRGMKASVVKGYQALTFHGADLVEAGLADEVATFDEMLSTLQSRVSGGPGRKQGGSRMGKEIEVPGAEQRGPGGEMIAMNDHLTAKEKAERDGRLAGQQDERARVSGINRLVSFARGLPPKKAAELAAKCIADGISVEQAGGVFQEAQVEHDKMAAGNKPITGPTGSGAGPDLGGIEVPVLQDRRVVMAARNRKMQGRVKGISAAMTMNDREGFVRATMPRGDS